MERIDVGNEQAKNTRERGGNGGTIPPPEHRWQPGQSGNPKGRPRGRGITDRLRKLVEEDDDGKLAAELAKAATDAARKGDFRFWNAIVERLDGKVKDAPQDEHRDHSSEPVDTPVDAVAFPSGAIPGVPQPGEVQGDSGGAQVGQDGDSEAEVGGGADRREQDA